MRKFCLPFFSLALALHSAEPGHAVPVTALAFHPGGKYLVSGGYKQLLVWDLATNRLARTLSKLSGQVRAIAIHKDGRTLAVSEGVPGRSGAVSLVDFETGDVTCIEQSKDEMLAVAFSPDGKLLATGGTDTAVRVWTVADRHLAATLKYHTDWISALAFSTDGKLLATGSLDKTVRVWDTATWKVLYQLPQTLTDAVNGAAFSPEGDLLAFAVGGLDEHAIRTWRPQNAFVELDPSRPGQRNTLMQTRPVDLGVCLPLSVAFVKAQPHSRMLVGCTDKTVRVLGAPGGNTIASTPGHNDWVYTVAASPDGSRFASGSGDGTVKLWDAAGKPLATLRLEPPQ
jgi:WD40 repeat protein